MRKIICIVGFVGLGATFVTTPFVNATVLIIALVVFGGMALGATVSAPESWGGADPYP